MFLVFCVEFVTGLLKMYFQSHIKVLAKPNFPVKFTWQFKINLRFYGYDLKQNWGRKVVSSKAIPVWVPEVGCIGSSSVPLRGLEL